MIICHNVSPYLAVWKQKKAQQKERDRAVTEKAKAVLPELITLLVNEFQANKIILFGSLAKGKFTETSDIDLAVGGIPPKQLFKAIGEVNSCSDFAVDLKPLEELHPHFYQRVLETGSVIYDSSIAESTEGNCQ